MQSKTLEAVKAPVPSRRRLGAVVLAVAAALAAGSAFAGTNYGNSYTWTQTWHPGVWNSTQGIPGWSVFSSTCVNPTPTLTTTTTTGTCANPSSKLVRVGTSVITTTDGAYTPGSTSTSVQQSNLPDSPGSVVAYPASGNPTGKLLLFLGGYLSTPDSYSYFVERAVADGYAAAISLQYFNRDLIAGYCSTMAWTPAAVTSVNACYVAARGEAAFGRGTAYENGLGLPTYSMSSYSAWTPVSTEDSIVGRVVLLLDALQKHPPAGTNAAYWSQFLVNDANSPYFRAFVSPGQAVHPNWSRIVISGHSQGGGQALFIPAVLPANLAPIPRGLMLSSPADYYTDGLGFAHPMPWIVNTPAPVAAKFWGLRHGMGPFGISDEVDLAQYADLNWQHMGGTGLPGGKDFVSYSLTGDCLSNGLILVLPQVSPCTASPLTARSGSGSGYNGQTTHRYVITENAGLGVQAVLDSHDSTAANSLATNVTTYSSQPTQPNVQNPAMTVGWVDPNNGNPAAGGGCPGSGGTCSVLNPNVAYFWDAMLTASW